MKLRKVLGIDVGGSGIKGAVIDTKTGEMLTERFRIPTPSPATPDKVAEVINEIVKKFEWDGLIGIGFPAVVQNGVAQTASNIDKTFIGTDVEKLVSKKTGCPVKVVNDADAAGMAEMKFGIGKDVRGVVVLITVGTGIGTVIFTNGKLVQNTELGHVVLKNSQTAEEYASDAVREKLDLSWADWGKRFNEYLQYMEFLFWPDLFIVGGGVSKNEHKYIDQITVKTKVVMAKLKNNAGMVGAALFAKKMYKDAEVLSDK